MNTIRITVIASALGLCCTAVVGQMANMPGGTSPQAPQQQPMATGQNPMGTDVTSTDGAVGQNAQVVADRMFFRIATKGGMAEVEMGKLAASKAANEEVKQFGQKMVADHTMLNASMVPFAQALGVKMPKHLLKKDSEERAKLEGLSGREFDQEYLSYMVVSHRNDDKVFNGEMRMASDPQLKDAVANAQKLNHQHLLMVQKLAQEQGVVVHDPNGAVAKKDAGVPVPDASAPK